MRRDAVCAARGSSCYRAPRQKVGSPLSSDCSTGRDPGMSLTWSSRGCPSSGYACAVCGRGRVGGVGWGLRGFRGPLDWGTCPAPLGEGEGMRPLSCI